MGSIADQDADVARRLLDALALARRLLPRGEGEIDGNARQVLVALWLEPTAGPSTIARDLATSPSVVSQALSRLRSAGLITEEFADRRTRTATLTRRGRQVLREVLAHARDELDRP